MRSQPEPNPSNSKKPEWFELINSDAPSAQVAKVNKKLPLMGAVVAGAMLVSGALFAGASTPGSSNQSSIVASGQSANSTASTSNQAEPVVNSVSAVVTSGGASAGKNPSIQNPAAGGMKAPGYGGDNDDDEDDDDEDDD